MSRVTWKTSWSARCRSDIVSSTVNSSFSDRCSSSIAVPSFMPDLRPVSWASAAGPPVVGGGDPLTGADAVVVGAAEDVPSAGASRRTAAAAVLNNGCLDTGSQSVTVSSLAARPAPPPGWAPSAVSQ